MVTFGILSNPDAQVGWLGLPTTPPAGWEAEPRRRTGPLREAVRLR